jgi:hypothetical protein
MNLDERDNQAVNLLESRLMDFDVFDQNTVSRIKLDLNAIRRSEAGIDARERIERIASRVADYCTARPTFPQIHVRLHGAIEHLRLRFTV